MMLIEFMRKEIPERTEYLGSEENAHEDSFVTKRIANEFQKD